MNSENILSGKQILIVDDESDVLESLVELLDMCKIDTASSFKEGKQLLEGRSYDLAILDIMGVKGFDLLKITKDKKIPAIMLTANSLSKESLKKSAESGAAFFVPKDKMIDIEVFSTDVLTSLNEKKSTWEKLFDRLGRFYDDRFHGAGWREKEKEFWEKKMRTRF
ncbi:MAG: response regulator [Desulfobacteraceae bacterium]|nr:response regulator [Desulfobacteraceae bacterium]